MQYSFTLSKKLLHKRWLYLAAAMALGTGALFAAFYLLSGYEYLVHWWTGLNECFYEHEKWTENFFTPEVKSRGNILCLLALAVCLPGLAYTLKKGMRLKAEKGSYAFTYSSMDVAFLLTALLTNLGLWLWGKGLVPAIGDEVRSALDSAAIHPFQTLSYYSLPNNHVLFNFINNTIFHYADDKVLTGKLISLTAYLIFPVATYFWFRNIFRSDERSGPAYFALLGTILLSLQFPVWGFSFQGRGYELYNVMGWLAFISIMQYLNGHKHVWLRLQAFCTVIGYALVPTFMYYHLAVMMFMFTWQVYSWLTAKRVGGDDLTGTALQLPDEPPVRSLTISTSSMTGFWKYQGYAFFFVFLFYLPTLCFSGIEAFSESKWIKMQEISLSEFLKIPPWRYYIDYTFSWFEAKPTTTGLLLFLSPLLLFFGGKRSLGFKLAVLYICLVAAVVIIFIVMKRHTFHRTMIIQYSLILSMLIYLVYILSNILNRKLGKRSPGYILFTAAIVSLGAHIFMQNKKHGAYVLYYSDMHGWHHAISEGLDLFPEGATIAFSAEAYNWKYLAQDKPIQASECIEGTEEYLVIEDIETYPSREGYELIHKVREFEIYKRK